MFIFIEFVKEVLSMLVSVAFPLAMWGIDVWWLGIFEYTGSHGFAQLMKGPSIFFCHSIFSVFFTTNFRFIGELFPYMSCQLIDTSRQSPLHWK